MEESSESFWRWQEWHQNNPDMIMWDTCYWSGQGEMLLHENMIIKSAVTKSPSGDHDQLFKSLCKFQHLMLGTEKSEFKNVSIMYQLDFDMCLSQAPSTLPSLSSQWKQ